MASAITRILEVQLGRLLSGATPALGRARRVAGRRGRLRALSRALESLRADVEAATEAGASTAPEGIGALVAVYGEASRPLAP